MSDTRRSEAGIALVLALLALMLLTFLGLTLATTTSTELQIATNYRWSQQAFYNAEAGIEVGKKVLANVDWATILPVQRSTGWTGGTAPTTSTKPVNPGGSGSDTRDYENWQCDQHGNGAGYGRVLVVSGTNYSNVSNAFAQNIRGAFTLWIRRPLVPDPATSLLGDAPGNTDLVLIAEGVAPYVGTGVSSVIGQTNKAVRTMEVHYSRTTTTQTCGARGGQVGGSEGGAGFGGCTPVDKASLGAALGQAAPTIEDTAGR